MLSSKVSTRSAARPALARAPVRARVVKPVAALDPQIVVSGSTAALLSLGRFVWLPYQRRSIAKSEVGPKTTGTTFFDNLQKPASFVMTSKDPSGFNIIDVMGWGALGHVVAFAALAGNSLSAAGVQPYPH
ncbi:hypothetical protein FOA52_010340 [Chlamydomonas sp. UWO 241]|nr:hypothetical protein FOA52_010340 [Chlamydomonas sp. UWO 241]